MTRSEAKFAIIVSTFNSNITEPLLSGAVATLMQSGIGQQQIDVFKVPGAVEIPLTAKLLAMTKKYQAIICLGAVIRGDTDHYEYVCQQVSQGCQQVMLEFTLPVIFGILTTKNERQAKARVTKPDLHKGIEAAKAALAMIDLTHNISLL